MKNKRMKFLSKILEEDKIRKLAQQEEIEGEIDQTKADQLAEQIFDKLFEDAVKNIGT